MIRRSIAVALFLMSTLTAVSSRGFAAPTAAAFPASGPIKLDGVLDETSWSAAPWQTGFVSASAASENARAPKPVAVQTRFKVLYDANAMYVGVECDEPQIDQLRATVTEHDGMVYGDDCVEIFFDPAGEGRYYHHFVVNAKGAWYDDYGADYGLVSNKLWDCPLEVGTAVDKAAKVWRVEVRIPFAALNLRADAGATWLWNIARERYATGALELSTWSPLKGNFHSPKLFGKLTGVEVDFKSFNFDVREPQVAVSAGGGNDRTLNLKFTVTNQSPSDRNLIVTAQVFGKPETAIKSQPLVLKAGASGEASLPPLTVPRDATESEVQFSLIDADTNIPRKVVVKRLDAEYRPLTLTVLQPVYRNNIYTTEKVPQIVFTVKLSQDVAERSREVSYQLADAEGKTVRVGKTPIAKIAEKQVLEATSLPTGTYNLVVQAVGADGATLAEQKTTIRKLPPAQGSEVRIDENRSVVVNGKPKVFLGWYGNVSLEDPRPEVVALQDLQTPVVLNYPDVSPLRKSFQEHGIYSIVSVEPGRLFYSFNLWQKPGNTVNSELSKLSSPSDECRGYVKQMVDLVKNEPGLLGYYLADEPEISNTRSDYLESFYRMMQELDPYHPVMITNDTLDGIVTHGYKASDILSPDPYSNNYDYVPNFMKKVLEVASRGKATMMTPWQSSGQAHFTNDYGTAPPYTYKETRNQYLAGIAFGCRGYTGYTSSFFMPEPTLRYGLPRIWREVRFLEPATAAPAPAEPLKVEADAEMATWIRQLNGRLYLIAVNHKPGARKVKLSHPLLKAVTSLEVASEARKVAVKEGAFTDSFAEGDAHVYTTDPNGRKLPTTTTVEKEIATQEAACAKPGNLLYWARGVRARASEGYYAPWFYQYYYYAINGITDDMGWYVSNAQLPQWLELTLPKVEKIGRIVVYTPNLRDYDLQFFSPDGGTQVAEIRGNMANVAEHNFNPPISTLKLRITARAVPEGVEPKQAMVREIEAYEKPGAGAITSVHASQAAAPTPVIVQSQPQTGAPELWKEDFANFRSAGKLNYDGHDDKWVFNPNDFKAEPKLGGGIVCISTAAVGYAPMSHFFPYDSAYRYLQIKIASIEGEGYKYTTTAFSDAWGKPGFRGAINSNKPGIYTVDTHYINDVYRTGAAKNCYLSLCVVGSAKQADGTIKPGARFTFDWIRLGRQPQNGLAVTLADGSPLPPVLKSGDELLFHLYLDQPAADATVDIQKDSNYTPLPINGEPSVQLMKVGDKDGREWAAQVKLGPGTGKFDVAKSGYPVLFRATMVGGAVKETFASAFVSFE